MATSLPKPRTLFDRDREWDQLVSFMSPEIDCLRLGVLYGRRRQGKTELLQQLCELSGGFYSLALEQHARSLALQRFANGLTNWADLPTGMRFTSWEEALETTVRMASERAARTGETQLIVLDELPFLMAHSPEIPGVIQWLYDTYGPTRGGGKPPVRLIVCGSALSVMSKLLTETQALYGRAQLNICLKSFDHRDAADYWGIDHHETALRLHAIIGGVPGYKQLTTAAGSPRSPEELDNWLVETVFNPAHAMFDEVDLLFSQEPGFKERSLYYGMLAAIASGESTPTGIARRLDRDPRTMSYPLATLRRAGFISYDEDMLRKRKPIVSLADPIMRFHHVITIPRLQLFQRGSRAAQAWRQAQQTFSAQIMGPHFEWLAREWTISTLAAREDLHLGWTGTTTVPCREHSANHQVDVLALSAGDMPQTPQATISLLGEAKATNTPRSIGDVARLLHIRELLGQRAAHASLAVFSLAGFSDDLVSKASERDDILLFSLEDLYRKELPV